MTFIPLRFINVLILTVGISCSVFGDNAYEYHCPSIKDITFDNDMGNFEAHTDYNGLTLYWYSVKNFYNKKTSEVSFDHAGTSDCSGDTCTADCVYQVDHDKFQGFFLNIQYNSYAISKIGSGPWSGNPGLQMCYAADPAQCTFYLVNNPI